MSNCLYYVEVSGVWGTVDGISFVTEEDDGDYVVPLSSLKVFKPESTIVPCVSSSDGNSILEPKHDLSFLVYILNSLVKISVIGESSSLTLLSVFSLGIGFSEVVFEST